MLWANATGKITESFEGTTKEKVKFLFKHALSRLGYTVKLSGNYSPDNATFTLKKITLAGSPDETTKAFYTKGTIDLSTVKDPTSGATTGLWDTSSSDKQNFDWFSGTYEKLSKTASNPDKDNNYLFVIPQDFSKDKTEANPNVDELYVIVNYTITYSDNKTQTNTVYKQIKKDFKRGKAYMLNLTIGLPIEFDVNLTEGVGVEDWGEDDGINIGSNDNNPWDGIE